MILLFTQISHKEISTSEEKAQTQISQLTFSSQFFVCTFPYFFDYKMEFFSFQNNPKDLDPSCKTDLDLWDCLGRVKIGIIAKFHRTDLVI